MFYLMKIVMLLFLVTTILNGCGKPKNQTDTQKQQPKHTGYLRLPLPGSIETIDPGKIFDITHIELVKQLFVGLTDFDPKTYKVLPELAQNWQVSEDGTIYTFHLRQDAKWSNGKPMTAHDIVWAVQRNILPKTDSPYAHTLYILKNARAINQGKMADVTQLGARAIDDYTLEFTLTQAASYFPALTSLWTYRPLPRTVIEQHGTEWIQPAHIQTNGFYMLTEWEKGKRLVLKKNPHYYAANQVTIQEVHYYIVQEISLALAMYQKDELDIIGGQVYLQLPPREISRIKSDAILRKDIHLSPSFCTEWYGFKTQQPPLNNPLVRKAIAAALDKKVLLNVVIEEEHFPATTFTRPPSFGAVEPSEEIGISFSPKRAKAWLAEAGYPNGKGFPKVTLIYNTSKTHQKIAQAVKVILKYYLNIDIEIRAYDFLAYINMLNKSTKPLMFRMNWCGDYPDAHNWLYDVFHPKQGINSVSWNNREFAQVVEQAMRLENPAERQKLYQRAEQILTEEEVAIIPLYFSNTQFLVKPWVKNWYPMAFGGQHIRFWSLETQSQKSSEK